MRILAVRLLILLSALAFVGCSATPPKHADLLTTFNTNRANYEKLRVMAAEDKLFAVLFYGKEFAKRPYIFEKPQAIGISQNRADAYKRLMRQGDVQRIDVNEDGEVLLSMASWGMANRGWRVSAVWRTKPPERLLSSLDAFQKSSQDWETAYAPASGNWYFRITW